jgi:hypothetical protein
MATKTQAMSGMDSSAGWQADSDLRCLLQGQEIMKDKKRYAAALAKAKAQMDNLEEIQEEASEEAKEPKEPTTAKG